MCISGMVVVRLLLSFILAFSCALISFTSSCENKRKKACAGYWNNNVLYEKMVVVVFWMVDYTQQLEKLLLLSASSHNPRNGTGDFDMESLV